jgi:hypothetical protein
MTRNALNEAGRNAIMSEMVDVQFLSPDHFSRFPVWRFMNEREADLKSDTMMCPVEPLPADEFDNCIVGCQVRLADGELCWAGLSNVDVWNPLATEQFLCLSMFYGDEIFHLDRYFDPGFEVSGPEHLAAFLKKKMEAIFPISYDLTALSRGDPSVLRGNICAMPSRRLSSEQRMRLILRKPID